MGIRFSEEDALSKAVAEALDRTLDSAIEQLAQEDALAAQRIESAAAESANDLLADIDTSELSPEEQAMFAAQPPLLLEITPPPPGPVPLVSPAPPPAAAQAFNFLGVPSDEELDDDDDDDDDEPPPPVVGQRIEERLVIARFQIPQFRLGTINLPIKIKIPAKRKTFQIGPFSKTLKLNGIRECIGSRRLGRLCLELPTLSKTFSLGPYRRTFQIGPINQELPTPIPSIDIADSTQIFYVDIAYPSLFGGVANVRQVIIDCFNDAKDAAIQQLLFFVAFAASSGGASVAAGIQVAFTTFQNTFTDCLRSKVANLQVSVSGPGLATESIGPFKPFYLYGR